MGVVTGGGGGGSPFNGGTISNNLTVSTGGYSQLLVEDVSSGGQVQIDSLEIVFTDGNRYPFFVDTGQFKFHQNAAPDSVFLDTGQCALWFDKTNGAAKLMVKAKTANGTVVTGSLALT